MSYLASLFGYKFSILLLYLRIFGVNKAFRFFTWLTVFFVFGYLCSNFFTQLFGCRPPNKYWHSSYAGHCIDYTKAGLAYGSMNIISDLIIFVLPLPMIWRLQLSRKEKIGVSLMFMTGVITCVVAIVRYVAIVQANAANAQYFVLSILEINIGLIISCVSTFRPFFNHVKSKAAASFLRYHSGPRTTNMSITTLQLRWNLLCCGIIGSVRYGKHTSSSSSRQHHAPTVDDGLSLVERGTAPPRIEIGSGAAHPIMGEGIFLNAGDEEVAGGSTR